MAGFALRRIRDVEHFGIVLFMVGTLLALVLALTVGLFGIHEVLSFKLVPTTLVVESIGTIILAVTVALVLRSRRAP